MENVIWLGLKAWERWKLWMVTVSFLLFSSSLFLCFLLGSVRVVWIALEGAWCAECVCILEYECLNLQDDVHEPSLVRPREFPPDAVKPPPTHSSPRTDQPTSQLRPPIPQFPARTNTTRTLAVWSETRYLLESQVPKKEYVRSRNCGVTQLLLGRPDSLSSTVSGA